jgi:hypothetical protein
VIRQLLPADTALPQMRRLLDVDVMTPILEHMLDQDTTLADVSIRYLRYKPGKRLHVCYQVQTSDSVHEAVAIAEVTADLAAQANAPHNLKLAHKASTRSPARTPLAYNPDLDALIQWSPLDLDLPALAESPQQLRQQLQQAGLAIDNDDLPRLIKHKPRNRAVMRLNHHFLKIYANTSAFAESIHAQHTAASLPLRTAKCEAIVPDLRMAVQSLVAGHPPSAGAEVASQAGALLAVLHGTQSSGLPLEPSVDQLDHAFGDAELVCLLVPSLKDRVDRLLRKLELELPDDPLVPSHGGFRRSQLLESDGELGVIDFDGFCRSPAARDIASFTASLVEEPSDLPEAAVALDVLTDGYGRRPPGVMWYVSTYLLRRTRYPFTRLEEDWPDQVESRLSAAELALDL